MVSRSYFVTGANSGCGLEATRQLAIHFSPDCHTDDNTIDETIIIYLLCRSEEKARDAIEAIRESIRSERGRIDENAVRLRFMKFDAYDDEATIRKNIVLALGDADSENMAVLGGVVLNAGGFGDARAPSVRGGGDSEETHPVACGIAKLNLLGHVILVRQLLALARTDGSTRIVAVGSEAAFVTPGLNLAGADLAAHLEGSVPLRETVAGKGYGWIKAIVVLYWAAFARRHPDLYVVTVSPGSVPGTSFLNQGAVSPFVRWMARVSTLPCIGGYHTVADGARRYVDALLGEGDVFGAGVPPPSGSFLASRKGFAGDFGDVSELDKGAFLADAGLQDEAWAAVERFLPPTTGTKHPATNRLLS